MCIKIIDNTKETSLEEALVYLQSVKRLTHDNEIVWTEWCDYEHGVENYYYHNSKDGYFALLTLISDGNGERFQLYIEKTNGDWYTFDDRYNQVLSNIYNWMTVEIDNSSKKIIDADFEEVIDNTPFEFVVNSNYNFESLG